jgi:hypothetical protein
VTLQQRMEKVYLLITAAQALIESGHNTKARGLIQSARIVATMTDDFLALNNAQVVTDLDEATAVIAALMGGKKTATT